MGCPYCIAERADARDLAQVGLVSDADRVAALLSAVRKIMHAQSVCERHTPEGIARAVLQWGNGDFTGRP